VKPYLFNPNLETRAPDGWQGTPLDTKGLFRNLNFPFWPEFGKMMRWQTQKNPQKQIKRTEKWLPEVQADGDFLQKKDNCFVWLGHSSFFIRLAGVGILIDPVFGKASVVKRHSPFPYPADIAKKADFLLISHDHRDHCDGPSLKAIFKQNPGLKILTGLNMTSLLSSFLPGCAIEEAGWYQKYSLSKELDIWFLPSRHWSRRSLNDTNKRLWGGFLISGGGQNLYFMGDSGMDNHFTTIGSLFPDIHFAIMGIGAYSPEWFMHPSHMKPEDSWQAFKDLKADHFIPMHYGTFDLADEPLSEPLNRLKAVADSSRLMIPAIGQSIWI